MSNRIDEKHDKFFVTFFGIIIAVLVLGSFFFDNDENIKKEDGKLSKKISKNEKDDSRKQELKDIKKTIISGLKKIEKRSKNNLEKIMEKTKEADKKYSRIVKETNSLKKDLEKIKAFNAKEQKRKNEIKTPQQIKAENYFKLSYCFFAFYDNLYQAQKYIDLALLEQNTKKYRVFKKFIQLHIYDKKSLSFSEDELKSPEIFNMFGPTVQSLFYRRFKTLPRPIIRQRRDSYTDIIQVKEYIKANEFNKAEKKLVELGKSKFGDLFKGSLYYLKGLLVIEKSDQYKEAKKLLSIAAAGKHVEAKVKKAELILREAKVWDFVKWCHENKYYHFYDCYANYEIVKSYARVNHKLVYEAFTSLSEAASSFSKKALFYMHIIYTSGLLDNKYYVVATRHMEIIIGRFRPFDRLKHSFLNTAMYIFQREKTIELRDRIGYYPYNDIFVKEVEKSLRLALNNDFPRAKLLLASVYLKNFKKIRQGVNILKDQVSEGASAKAYELLANVYFTGLAGIPKDVKKGINLYRKTLDFDVTKSRYAFKVANIYYKGEYGVEVDLESAELWYKISAFKGNIVASYKFANIHFKAYQKDPNELNLGNLRFMIRYYELPAKHYLPALHEKGLALIAIGKKNRGLDCIERAARLGYEKSKTYLLK